MAFPDKQQPIQPHPWIERPSVYQSEKGVNGIDEAPLSIVENQVIPVNDLSKSFQPNLATIRVLSLGTTFFPKWNQHNWKKTFFVEDKPRVCVQCKQFRVKGYFIPPAEVKKLTLFAGN